jgi:hypothetical protein
LREEIDNETEMFRLGCGEDRFQFYGIKRPSFDFWDLGSLMKKNRKSAVNSISLQPNL